MANPTLVEQSSALPDALPPVITNRQSSQGQGKKQKSQRTGDPAQSKNTKPILPEHLRRPLTSRIDDILADPHSMRCQKPCPICESVPDDVVDAALAQWDARARSGEWPITTPAIRAALLVSGIEIRYVHLDQIISHRRWRVLDRLVRDDLKAHNRQRAADAGTLPGPQ
jgi:hypothetical protein